jgi:dTDP-4-dehydrorhamnose reductase
MSQRTVLVTGATGLLGREVVRAFKLKNWNVKGTGLSRADGVDVLKVDLSSEAEVKKVLDETKPHVIVHAAAQRFPDKVDKDPDAAKALNITASKSLANLAAAQGICLLYISTDYVFPGVPGEAPYEADATPRPTNLYGETKLDGERAVLEEYSKAGKEGLGLVLRVPVLYGHADNPSDSAVNTLMDSLWKSQSEGAKVTMDHWALRYPTNTEDVARVSQGTFVSPGHGSNRQSFSPFLALDTMPLLCLS